MLAAAFAGACLIGALGLAFLAGYGLADAYSDYSRAVVGLLVLALLLTAGSAALLVSGAHQ